MKRPRFLSKFLTSLILSLSGNNHYISIIGYDSFSDVVLISNSHYGNAYFGEFSVLSSSLYDSILTLFYPSELN